MSRWAANYVVEKINQKKPTADNPFVLGCPTGSSPLGMYKELIRHYKEGDVSFENVVTFNMDEYVGLPKEHRESYYSFMWSNFFSHIDIKRENVHILNGNAPDLVEECENYERQIEAYGGIDLFLGGIGPDGHIAFNDPHVAEFNDAKMVKVVELDDVCRQQQVNDGCFAKLDDVPKTALTLTIPTLINVGYNFCVVPAPTKANAVKNTVHGEISEKCPATILRNKKNAIMYCDKDAASLL